MTGIEFIKKYNRIFVWTSLSDNGKMERARIPEWRLRMIMAESMVNGVNATQMIEGEEPLTPEETRREIGRLMLDMPEHMLTNYAL